MCNFMKGSSFLCGGGVGAVVVVVVVGVVGGGGVHPKAYSA